MRKAMEFWIFREDIKLMNLHHHVIGPNGVHLKEDSTALERPEEWIHVKEVLDPDPRDETIKIMREALEYYSIEVPYEEIVQVENWCTLDCPEDCKDETHWTKRIAKVRLVGHNMKTAREALAAVEKLERE